MLPHFQFRTLAFRPMLLAVAALAAAWLASAGPAAAVLRLDVTGGNVQPMPIGIPRFIGGGDQAALGQSIAAVIASDLRGSGLFLPIDGTPPADASAMPGLGEWQAANAQALVVGGLTPQGDGKLRAEFRLWDVVGGQQMAGSQFTSSAENWRRIAHIIADAIYERLTGEKGYFDTRVVYVDENDPQKRQLKRVAIMDQDGANATPLTNFEQLMTPRFSPTGAQVVFAAKSGESQDWSIYVMDLKTRKPRALRSFPSAAFSPRFSPDGRTILFSLVLDQGARTNLFALDVASGQARQLTNVGASDVSANFSPDGSQIVFESDRGGSQQIYVMGADGSNPQRISHGEGTYSTPAWSPRGDLIAFTRQAGGQFGIGVIRPDGSAMRVLSDSALVSEGPTWAPNGRMIMFSRNTAGADRPQLWRVNLQGQESIVEPKLGFASDPSWAPALNK